MLRSLRGHIRSNVVGYVALFFALGLGTAWAATELQRNEVKSKHIGKGQVKEQDLAGDAVTSPKVLNGSLLAEDFGAGQLPQGPQGAEGPPGVPGAPGVSGYQVVESKPPATASPTQQTNTVRCPTGKRVLGGGAQAEGLGATSTAMYDSHPLFANSFSQDGWGATAREVPATTENWALWVYAICANAP